MLPSGYVNVTELLLPVIETAIAGKVKVVFQSVLGVDAIAKSRSHWRHPTSPMSSCGQNWFSDNFHTFWKPGIAQGRLALPAGEGKTSFIDARDIAASAAAVLTSSRFDGGTFDLTGPAALSYAQATFILSNVVGRPVEYEAITDEPFTDILTGADVPREYASFLATIFQPVRQGWTSIVTGEVETLTGTAPRSVVEYAADNAALLKA